MKRNALAARYQELYRVANERRRQLERELKIERRHLKIEKRDAMEALNNQRETIAELQARAVPEGWAIRTADRREHGLLLHVARVYEGSKLAGWAWSALGVTSLGASRHGCGSSHSRKVASTLNEAVQQAEKAGKKVKR